MKLPNLMICSVVGLAAISLTGCVDPYYAGGTATTSVYRPGYQVTALPPGYRTETYGGQRYHYHNNVYYRPQGRGYVVVDAPRRNDRLYDDRLDRRSNVPGPAVVRRLPDGYRVVTHGGNRYYRAGNDYYQSQGQGYVVVRSPY